MSARCLRCGPDAYVDHPEEHALEHPVCVRCSRSLAWAESNACALCIQRLEQNLTDLISAHEELPDIAYTIGGSRHQHPGGQALAQIGPGSDGRSQLHGVRLRDGSLDTSHERDERPSDPASISTELGRIEDDWRRVFGHPAAQPPATGQLSRPRGFLNGVVRQAARYLQDHAEWCATSYPDGFVDAAECVWRLRQSAWSTLGLLEPREARAFCFDCREDDGTESGKPRALETEGDLYVCSWCNFRCTREAYLVALRAGLEARHAG